MGLVWFGLVWFELDYHSFVISFMRAIIINQGAEFNQRLP